MNNNDPITPEAITALLDQYGLGGDGTGLNDDIVHVANSNTGGKYLIDLWQDTTMGGAKETIARELGIFDPVSDFDRDALKDEDIWPTLYVDSLYKDQKYYRAKAREMRGLPPEPEQSEAEKLLEILNKLPESDQQEFRKLLTQNRS